MVACSVGAYVRTWKFGNQTGTGAETHIHIHQTYASQAQGVSLRRFCREHWPQAQAP